MSGTIQLPHTCPNCKKVTATTAAELLELFGIRTVSGKATNQSWCRNCR